MPSLPPPPGSSRLSLAFACAGLLVVPLVAWLLLPPLTPTPRAHPAQPALAASVERASPVRPATVPRAAPPSKAAAAREPTNAIEDPEGPAALAGSATITGKVTDAATHEPIVGASVAVDGAWLEGGDRPRTTTDASGAFTLTGLSEGRLTIRVSHEGYGTRTLRGVQGLGGETVQRDVELSPSDSERSADPVETGLVLATTPKGIAVALVLPYGSAARAGLVAGDRVLAVDGVSMEGAPLSDARERTTCSTNSPVTLRVAHGDDAPRDVVLPCEGVTH